MLVFLCALNTVKKLMSVAAEGNSSQTCKQYIASGPSSIILQIVTYIPLVPCTYFLCHFLFNTKKGFKTIFM